MTDTYEPVPAILTKSEKVYVGCPWCGEATSDISHIKDGARHDFYPPWHCDHCGRYYQVKCADSVWVRKVENEPTYKKLVLLQVPPQAQPLYLVVEASEYFPEKPCGDGDEYLYDEHTCPTNWLRDVLMVIQGDSADPHGFAQWVASIPAGDLLEDNGVDESGNSKLDYLDQDPSPGGGWSSQGGQLAKRVLALFGVEDGPITVEGEGYTQRSINAPS